MSNVTWACVCDGVCDCVCNGDCDGDCACAWSRFPPSSFNLIFLVLHLMVPVPFCSMLFIQCFFLLSDRTSNSEHSLPGVVRFGQVRLGSVLLEIKEIYLWFVNIPISDL